MKNSISVIKPYKWEGMWVFDDPPWASCVNPSSAVRTRSSTWRPPTFRMPTGLPGRLLGGLLPRCADRAGMGP